MKHSLVLILLLIASHSIAQVDTALVRKTGADEYGMRHYVMVFLKSGPRKDIPKDSLPIIQKGHMENIGKLAKEGKLVVAGPFEEKSDLRGIFILNTASMDEARKLTESDPAVKAGRLIMELHPWYGSAALMEVNGIHEKIQKKQH